MSTSPLFSDETKLTFDRQILAVLESINDGFIILNSRWCYTYVNHAAETILQKKCEDLLGKNVWEIFPEAVGTTFWTKYYEAADTQTIIEFDELYPPFDKWFHVRVYPSEAGLAVFFQDITERKHGVEETQRQEQSAELQANLIELAHNAILMRDPASTIVSWNRGAEELYGWTAQEAIGKVTHNLLQTRFPTSREALDSFLATGERWEGELVHTRKDGTQVIVESRQVLMRNQQSQPITILESNRDITERKQRERENQEQYRTIVQTANEGIWLIDAQAQTLYINDRMANMLGSTVEEVVGRVVPEFVFPDDQPKAQERIESNLQGTFEQFDFRFRRKDGSPLHVLACTSPVRDGRGMIAGALGMFTDVTERKQAEEVGLQLAALVESSDDAIIGKTLEGIITSWNRAAARMYGYTAEEVVGQPITLIFPPDRQDEFAKIMEQLRRGEHVDRYETTRVRKDGTIIPVSVTVSPIHDTDGQIIGAFAITHDLTERKRVEEQEYFLAEVSKVLTSTLDYQETLANIARLVVPQLADWFTVDLVDAEGHFELIEVAHKDPEQVQWARALREKYPIDPNGPTGAPHVVRTGQSELYPNITDEMLVASARNEEELAIARQIGYTSVMIVPLVAHGKTLGVVTFVSTESGRRYDERYLALAEEVGRRAGVALDNARLYREVKQARDQLDIILRGVADGIIVYDPHSQIIYANEAAAQMTGYASIQEMLQTPPLGIVAKYEIVDEQGQPFPRSRLTHQRVFVGEREAQATIGYAKAGTGQPERWSLVKSRPVLNERGGVALVITIIHDITERVQAERRKDEFISMTSHELKTPVTSLKGFTHVLQRRLEKQGDEQGLHYLARMDAQLNKLTKLISDLLDVSRIQTGKLAFQMESFDLDTLIDETIENVQAATTTHQFIIEGRTDAHVLGDKDRLCQVFINLFTNAVKYSPGANKVLVHLSHSSEYAIVSVQDFGIGIDEAHHQKIFERFYQVTDPEEKTYPGLGIGLYISREIVKRHHGRIGVQSRKGQGATFSVTLPLLQEGK